MMSPALRLASIAIGFCVYAGLAILGWAGFRSFFSHPALIALVAVLFSLSGLAFFAGENLSPGVREARGNRWVIPVFVVMDWSTRICRHTPIAKSCGRLTVHDSLARCRTLHCWRCIADLVSVCAGPTIQRLGRDSVGTQAGN